MALNKPTSVQIDLLAGLQKWRVFLAIAELGSLTRAALFLNSNQSLLSRQLNALERECGARLFVRTGRGVELAELGARILPQVRALLIDAEQLEGDIRGKAHEAVGRVTLGSLPSIAHPLVGGLFAELRTRYPGIHLKVLEGSSGQVQEWLADGRVDIAILYRYGESAPEGEQTLATVESYLVGPAGDRVTAVREVPFRALDNLPFILPSAPNGLRAAVDHLARQAHITLEPVIEADSLPLQKSLVIQERLYTVLPLHAVWDVVLEGKAQAARIVDPPFRRLVAMAFAKNKGPGRAVMAVAEMVRQRVEQMVQDDLR